MTKQTKPGGLVASIARALAKAQTAGAKQPGWTKTDAMIAKRVRQHHITGAFNAGVAVFMGVTAYLINNPWPMAILAMLAANATLGAIGSFYTARVLNATPGYVRYLYAIKHELGNDQS